MGTIGGIIYKKILGGVRFSWPFVKSMWLTLLEKRPRPMFIITKYIVKKEHERYYGKD
tara:strand:+ start:12414 stop:12587 length:174 start_codon:yes stop_codon:yes gene_type:complete